MARTYRHESQEAIVTTTEPHRLADGPDGDPAATPAQRLMSIDEVAAYLQLSPRWVYEQVRRGHLPALLIARSWRIRPQALDAFAESFRYSGDDLV
jgi:excisionase family DNA binding protein